MGGRILAIDTAVAHAARRFTSLTLDQIVTPSSRAKTLVHGLTVATRNVADFEPLGVGVLNLWNLEHGSCQSVGRIPGRRQRGPKNPESSSIEDGQTMPSTPFSVSGHVADAFWPIDPNHDADNLRIKLPTRARPNLHSCRPR